MAIDKKKIIVYTDWLSNFEDLTDEELGKLMRHFFMYVNDLNPVLEDRLLKLVWKPIENTLKRDLIKWEQRAENSRKNGGLGGRPKKNPTEPKKPSGLIDNPTEPKKPVSDSVSVSVSDSVTNNKLTTIKKEKTFSTDVKSCYKDLLLFFPENLQPKNLSIQTSWLETVEKLNRIDKIPFELITEIVKKAREDSFTAGYFLSLTKLRKNNTDGIKYIVAFSERFKNKVNNTKSQQNEEFKQLTSTIREQYPNM